MTHTWLTTLDSHMPPTGHNTHYTPRRRSLSCGVRGMQARNATQTPVNTHTNAHHPHIHNTYCSRNWFKNSSMHPPNEGSTLLDCKNTQPAETVQRRREGRVECPRQSSTLSSTSTNNDNNNSGSGSGSGNDNSTVATDGVVIAIARATQTATAKHYRQFSGHHICYQHHRQAPSTATRRRNSSLLHRVQATPAPNGLGEPPKHPHSCSHQLLKEY
jgi:hypothetical protein